MTYSGDKRTLCVDMLSKPYRLILVILLCGVAAGQTSSFVTFDPPGATSTAPQGINDGGTITGYYFDDHVSTHGFVRARDGQFVEFDAPGFVNTQASAINSNGQVVGHAINSGAPVTAHGFLRSRSGTFTLIDMPGMQNTIPQAISNSGWIVGYTYDLNPVRAFRRDASGNFSLIEPPDAKGEAKAWAVNDNGQVAGTYVDAKNQSHEFFRDTDGTITEFDPPNGTFLASVGPSMDAAGNILSMYTDSTTFHTQSFIRDIAGNFTILNVSGAQGTWARALNNLGQVVGWLTPVATSFETVGFRRTASGVYSQLPSPAGSLTTTPISVNTTGRIAGSYEDSTGVTHGFVF